MWGRGLQGWCKKKKMKHGGDGCKLVQEKEDEGKKITVNGSFHKQAEMYGNAGRSCP